MNPCFRELPIDSFMKRVPGDAPTTEERKKFKQVDCSNLTNWKVEGDWLPLLNETANSVFVACGSAPLVFLDTSTHRAAEHPETGAEKPTRTVNNAGIYWDTPEAREATQLTDQRLKNSLKISPEELKARGRVGTRNYHWVAIPVEVKRNPNKAAFLFRDPTPEKKPSSTAKPSQQPPRPGAVDDRPLSASDPTAPSGDHGQARDEEQANNTADAADGQELSADAEGVDPPEGQPETPEAKKFVRGSIEGEVALYQFAEYVLNVLNHQHRLFCYAIYVCRRMARLCFFDRGGAVVSEDFNWTTTDSPLHDFLWKVAHMKDEQLGYDPTATRVDAEEAEPFKQMANDSRVPEAIQKYVKAATAKGVPIYKLRIIPMTAPPDEGLPMDPASRSDQSSGCTPAHNQSPGTGTPSPTSKSSPWPLDVPKERAFLVGKPHFVTDSLVGRCTRGYVAYDLATGRLCFLKDYWRPFVPGRSRPEHLVHERLNSCGVANVATLICGGDVGGLRAQQTLAQRLLKHMKALPVPRIHYRIAMQEIGLPLEDFKNFKELALVFYDAIIAHHDAWTKVKVLHRDISVGNILIDPVTRSGILIDWDLCRFQWELASGPTEPNRTGTWRFRSALSLQYPMKPQRLSDDLESFIHAFRYLVLKYHTTTTTTLKDLVTSTFESASVTCGVKVGGETKLAQLRSAVPPFEVRNNPVLQAVLNDFHAGCYQSYRQLHFNKMEKLYAIVDPRLEALRPLMPTVVSLPVQQAVANPRRSLRAPTPAASQARSDRNDAASGEGAGTEPNDSASESEPCAVPGFLSHHGYLAEVLDRYQLPDNAQTLEDKWPNQFVLRGRILDEDVFGVADSESSDDSSVSSTTGSSVDISDY
ncbi:hypothetical protein C8T65DRAFT_811512 [Cerioporus squamosus]|nr:hypothetical protein C8T65DRAFT_811512 [Cerioporus squamosus]